MPTHILSANDIDANFFKEINDLAVFYKGEISQFNFVLNSRKILGGLFLFFQPSTRTRLSFRYAAKMIGLPVIDTIDSADLVLSTAKNESFENTIENAIYPGLGILIVRNKTIGSATCAARIANKYGVSVINAGDGPHQHPTQTLLDAFTMVHRRKTESVRDLKIVFANDISHNRVINSLVSFIGKNFNPKEIGLCAPDGVQLAEDPRLETIGRGISIRHFKSIREALRWGDFLYVGRPQIEYHPNEDYSKLFDGFQVTKELLDDLPADCPCVVMHAQPVDSVRYNEITPEAQNHPRCIMMEQKNNGLYVRMALLELLYQQLINNPS